MTSEFHGESFVKIYLEHPRTKKGKGTWTKKKAMPTEWKQYLQVNKYKEETRQGEPTVTEKEKDRIKHNKQ